MVFSLTGLMLRLFLIIVVLVCYFQNGIGTKAVICCGGSYSLTGLILGLFLFVVVLVCYFQKSISSKTMIGPLLESFDIMAFSAYCCFRLLLPTRY